MLNAKKVCCLFLVATTISLQGMSKTQGMHSRHSSAALEEADHLGVSFIPAQERNVLDEISIDGSFHVGTHSRYPSEVPNNDDRKCSRLKGACAIGTCCTLAGIAFYVLFQHHLLH